MCYFHSTYEHKITLIQPCCHSLEALAVSLRREKQRAAKVVQRPAIWTNQRSPNNRRLRFWCAYNGTVCAVTASCRRCLSKPFYRESTPFMFVVLVKNRSQKEVRNATEARVCRQVARKEEKFSKTSDFVFFLRFTTRKCCTRRRKDEVPAASDCGSFPVCR